MGLFDWVEMGDSDAAKKFEHVFKGSFSVTLGDALSSFVMGGRHAHIYGDEFKFVFDWESFLEGLFGRVGGALGLEGAFGIGGALLFGAGGNTTLTYGHNVGLTFGESIIVKRAVTAQSTGTNHLANWFASHDHAFAQSASTSSAPVPNAALQKKVDDICGVISAILSALMVAASLALELVAALKYPTGDPTKGLADHSEHGNSKGAPGAGSSGKNGKGGTGDGGSPGGGREPYVPPVRPPYDPSPPTEGPARMQTLLRTLSWTISSRLAALVIQVELIGQACRDGARDLWICQQLAAAVAKGRAWKQSMADTLQRANAGEEEAQNSVLAFTVILAAIAVVAGLIALAVTLAKR